jgi:hypothetical protein
MVEAYNGSLQFHVAFPSFGMGNGCDWSGTWDANYHKWDTVWTATSIQQYEDDVLLSTCNVAMTNPLFFIAQIQTGGISGTPANLPTTLTTDYVKVCNAKITRANCATATASDPNVIFYDDFNGVGTAPAAPTGLTAIVK